MALIIPNSTFRQCPLDDREVILGKCDTVLVAARLPLGRIYPISDSYTELFRGIDKHQVRGIHQFRSFQPL